MSRILELLAALALVIVLAGCENQHGHKPCTRCQQMPTSGPAH